MRVPSYVRPDVVASASSPQSQPATSAQSLHLEAGQEASRVGAGLGSRPRILFVVTEDWYFWSHRVTLAEAAVAAGWEVHLATRVREHGARIRAKGIVLHSLPWRRTTRNPLRELAALVRIAVLLRRLQPAILHLVAIKPVVFGNLAAWPVARPPTINAVSGLGLSYASRSRPAGGMRRLLDAVFRQVLRRPNQWLVVQNPADEAYFRDKGLAAPERIHLIPGAGVDTQRFRPAPEPKDGPIVAALVSRMMRRKGVEVAVEAVGRLRAQGLDICLHLVGAPDTENPDSIPAETLVRWHREGAAIWNGPREDIPEVWRDSHIAVLPSFYREGIPRSLIEAASSGRPMITCDVPGCRDFVRHGESGLVIPPRSSDDLADALRRLAEDPQLRRRMGMAARQDVEAHYGDGVILARFLELYCDVGLYRPAVTPTGRETSCR